MAGLREVDQIENGRGDVHQGYLPGDALAGGQKTWRPEDQGYVKELVIDLPGVSDMAMFAKGLTMVGCDNHQSFLIQIEFSQDGEELLQSAVGMARFSLIVA